MGVRGNETVQLEGNEVPKPSPFISRTRAPTLPQKCCYSGCERRQCHFLEQSLQLPECQHHLRPRLLPDLGVVGGGQFSAPSGKSDATAAPVLAGSSVVETESLVQAFFLVW